MDLIRNFKDLCPTFLMNPPLTTTIHSILDSENYWRKQENCQIWVYMTAGCQISPVGIAVSKINCDIRHPCCYFWSLIGRAVIYIVCQMCLQTKCVLLIRYRIVIYLHLGHRQACWSTNEGLTTTLLCNCNHIYGSPVRYHCSYKW